MFESQLIMGFIRKSGGFHQKIGIDLEFFVIFDLFFEFLDFFNHV